MQSQDCSQFKPGLLLKLIALEKKILRYGMLAGKKSLEGGKKRLKMLRGLLRQLMECILEICRAW